MPLFPEGDNNPRDVYPIIPSLDGTELLAIANKGTTLLYASTGQIADFVTSAEHDVTATAVIADNGVVRGDGGARGVQGSSITIDDNGNVAFPANTSISWNSADVSITESANLLSFSGAANGYSFDQNINLAAAKSLSWNAGAATITEASGALSINGTPFSASVQATGLNGIDGDQFFIYKEYTAAPGGAGHPSGELAVARVQRVANYTGGTPGNVENGLWVPVTVAAGVANYEWAVLATLDNSATGGQNVAVYGQSQKQSAAGPTWASVFETRDFSTNPTTGAVCIEADIFANGTDTNSSRIVIDVVAGRRNPGGTMATVAHGIRIGPDSGTAAEATYTNGITLSKNFATGINLSDADCTTADIVTKGAVGFGTSAPDRRLHSEVGDAVTNTTTYAARLTHTTSGTAAASFGVGLEAELENASGTNKVVGALDWIFTDATNATEDADLLIKLMTAGAAAAEVARFTSTKFLGVGTTPAVALDVLAASANAQVRVSDGTVDARMLSNGSAQFGSFTAHDTVILRNGAEAFRADAAGLNLASGKVMKVNSTQVVTARQTGWTAWTGTPDRTTHAAGAGATVTQISQALKALIDDLISHGLIGT